MRPGPTCNPYKKIIQKIPQDGASWHFPDIFYSDPQSELPSLPPVALCNPLALPGGMGEKKGWREKAGGPGMGRTVQEIRDRYV